MVAADGAQPCISCARLAADRPAAKTRARRARAQRVAAIRRSAAAANQHPRARRSYQSGVHPLGSLAGIASVRAVAELSKAAAYETDLNDRMMSYVREHGGDTLIRRVLIANNGMAAVKTIMSIRKWAYKTFGDERAVEFVVMASAEDLAANAEFIRRADSYVEARAPARRRRRVRHLRCCCRPPALGACWPLGRDGLLTLQTVAGC